MKQEMPDCKLCHAFIHDHLHAAVTISFKPRAARRILTSPVFAFQIVKEVVYVLAACIEYTKFYEGALEQCATMEDFHGREGTKIAFFNSYPHMHKLSKQVEYALFDAGAGKLNEITLWTQEQLYLLFNVLLRLHREHAKEIPVESLGAPLLYRPYVAPKKVEEVVYLQELPEDDLYA